MHHHRRDNRARLLGGAAFVALALATAGTRAQDAGGITIAPQPLDAALNELGVQSKQQVLIRSDLTVGRTTAGVTNAPDFETALTSMLAGTGLTYRKDGDTFLVVQGGSSGPQSAGAGGDVDALIVTAQKREENIQDVPIAISAFSQEELTTRQVAGGPDLMTQVPNFTFTKTNFSSYSIQIRGIGTQAISATVDPAVAIAFNNTSFVRNRFFEQEFYDLQRIEVLRGPQGTLYGRNATAGVVNILTAKPRFAYEAKASADVANYKSARLEAMINMPLVEDVVALRLAGAWTKRDGFVTNELTGDQTDGRDLWSTRLSLRFQPTDQISADFIWEHFEEDDDRLRSGKQLCKRDTVTQIGDVEVPQSGGNAGSPQTTYSLGCKAASMYSAEAFEVPNGYALPYYSPLTQIGLPAPDSFDPYTDATQSRDLRVIQSSQEPSYRAKSDVAELQFSIDLTPQLTAYSETAYGSDFLFSTQDFNRFNTRPGAFGQSAGREGLLDNGVFCDPQLGCSDRLVLGDLSTANSRQFSQELRLASDFDGPFNFNLGANFLRYDTEDKYYVFANSLTLWAANASWTGDFDDGDHPYDATWRPYVGGVSDNSECLKNRSPSDPTAQQSVVGCIYIDPNPVDSLNDQGHNYFLSRNPYKLISYAVFGEAYYNLSETLKVTAGLRWTVDKKQAPIIPSWLIVADTIGYPVVETVEQEWNEPTGRLAVDWKPDLGFTDETLLYASYAHGYKAGGMNPPPAVLALYQGIRGLQESLVQPKTFDAEFVDAFEIGAKNTLLDGRVTLNVTAFYYDYKNYQLSQIINRSAVTQNFDAEVRGIEIEADWRPLENLRLGFKGGYEDTKVADGEQAIDLMDRTAGHTDWVVIRPFPTIPSNCIVPVWLITFGGELRNPGESGMCAAYLGRVDGENVDPVTQLPYVPNPTEENGGNAGGVTLRVPLNDFYLSRNYPGFDPSSAPNHGEGFFKDLGGNELPNAPHFTTTFTADYTLPLANDWLVTLHADYYRQSKAWTRIFNFDPYDRLKPYQNVNFAAIFTNEDAGWHVMAYVKNVFDTDAITGAFLNSDDTGLTTNVFLLEPRLYGLRVTKQWNGAPVLGGLFGERRAPGEPYPITLELDGGVARIDAANQPLRPEFVDSFPAALDTDASQRQDLDWGDARAVKLTYRPGGGWLLSAGARFGRTNDAQRSYAQEVAVDVCNRPFGTCTPEELFHKYNYSLIDAKVHEEHTLVDFDIGKDVGLGATGTSSIRLGLRYAQFKSDAAADISGIPDYYLENPANPLKYAKSHTQFTSSSEAARSFEGAGPVISWEASRQLKGSDAAGHVNLDWAVSGGVLFGKQRAAVREESQAIYSYSAGIQYEYPTLVTLPPRAFSRSESVKAPTLGASLGLSYEIDRIKVGAGYRWERYFDVIDGGLEARETFDRTVDGPYFKVSVGFGG